jgi:cbb3-type cytochrome oxidase subunit 1
MSSNNPVVAAAFLHASVWCFLVFILQHFGAYHRSCRHLLLFVLVRFCILYFLALIRIFLRHFLATPRTSVSWAFSIIIATVWCIYGLSCLSSMIVSRKNASMLAVVLCMIPAALCVAWLEFASHLSLVTRFVCVAMDPLSTKLQSGTSSGFLTCACAQAVLLCRHC